MSFLGPTDGRHESCLRPTGAPRKAITRHEVTAARVGRSSGRTALQAFKHVLGGTLFLLASVSAHAQHGWMDRYQARLAATQLEQPHWATPLITTAPRLEQGFRTDFVHQSTAGGQSTWSYGNTQGLQFVPSRHIELRLSPPPFVTHTDRRVEDGFGDVAFRMKYRIYGSSEEHRNAILTALFAASIPTGKSGNGSCCAVLTPTLELGKGFGRFALITSAGGSLPVSNVRNLGHQVIWNNAIQLRASRFVWVETELNANFFLGSRNDGREQTFITPGVIVSRLPLTRGGPGRLVLTLGIGEQIALTHFTTYNHSAIFTSRLRF